MELERAATVQHRSGASVFTITLRNKHPKDSFQSNRSWTSGNRRPPTQSINGLVSGKKILQRALTVQPLKVLSQKPMDIPSDTYFD